MLHGNFLLLIDASSYIHRMFHANARSTRRSDGLPNGALQGFCWAMMKLIRLDDRTAIGKRPSHAAIVLDTRGKNHRHELYPLYKANRAEYDPDLEAQLPHISVIASAFNVPCIGVDGCEADDVIATYARHGEEAGLQVVVASSDKDLMQLVTESVVMYDAMKDKLYDIPAVIDKWKVRPSQMTDLQALMGDAVDNVPGVPSIGPVTAAKLINDYGSIANLLDDLDWIEPDKLRERIEAHQEDIRISHQLVKLKDDCAVPLDVEDLELEPADERGVIAMLRGYDFNYLARRVEERRG